MIQGGGEIKRVRGSGRVASGRGWRESIGEEQGNVREGRRGSERRKNRGDDTGRGRDGEGEGRHEEWRFSRVGKV